MNYSVCWDCKSLRPSRFDSGLAPYIRAAKYNITSVLEVSSILNQAKESATMRLLVGLVAASALLTTPTLAEVMIIYHTHTASLRDAVAIRAQQAGCYQRARLGLR
ncbi:hypothetical protein ETB97_012201 [Aspergillus alliaceus]|uniref:Uncharacterized protein n=1 Tax=Petromyces alliaceus TaxID=209559 RepID=A0A8H6A8C5_PETAA|nr:hypothetical protein ETB97_012201 [Aspergillus burnettii]